jgi:hypothetical protein
MVGGWIGMGGNPVDSSTWTGHVTTGGNTTDVVTSGDSVGSFTWNPLVIGSYDALTDRIWDGDKWVTTEDLARIWDGDKWVTTEDLARMADGRKPERVNYTPVAMIEMRLGGAHGFDHLTVYGAKEKTFVFIAHKGQGQILEDDPALFPSDKLITQLRLIK